VACQVTGKIALRWFRWKSFELARYFEISSDSITQLLGIYKDMILFTSSEQYSKVRKKWSSV
jgi:hypothetical protein